MYPYNNQITKYHDFFYATYTYGKLTIYVYSSYNNYKLLLSHRFGEDLQIYVGTAIYA